MAMWRRELPWAGSARGVGAARVVSTCCFVEWVGRQDVPAGSLTLDRSQSESVFLNSSYTLAGRFCLGMRAAIESAFCVGAAKRAAGASAKSRLKDAGKIIFVVA